MSGFMSMAQTQETQRAVAILRLEAEKLRERGQGSVAAHLRRRACALEEDLSKLAYIHATAANGNNAQSAA